MTISNVKNSQSPKTLAVSLSNNLTNKRMDFLYTARGTYDKTYDEDAMSWDKYIEWSKLTHLTELVSLDGMLNEILVEPDYNCKDDWNFIHVIEQYQTGFFTTLDFVFKRLRAKGKFNLLTVVLEPDQDYKDINIKDYEFVGYDLLDQDFSISALTNCGGFDETFLPTDLNDKGLIDDFAKVYDIKKRLLENNPDEHHADTNVIQAKKRHPNDKTNYIYGTNCDNVKLVWLFRADKEKR